MTYQQAGRIAVLKRIAGWVIFIPAVISTLISVLKFMYDHSEKQPGINAVMLDFAHVMIEMMRFNTPFLNVFWFNSPTPDFSSTAEYRLLGDICPDLCRAGTAGLWCENESPDALLREGVEDQLILEQAKGPEGMSREQIESRIVVPRHTIFLQIFPLYILPVIIIVAGYFFFSLLGFL